MKYSLIIFLSVSFLFSCGSNESSKDKVQSDQVLKKLLKDMPKELHRDFIVQYNKMSPSEKEGMIKLREVFSTVPTSSKKQLIKNIDTNYVNILALKSYFNKIVPVDYAIYVEFKPPEKLLNIGESVDFWAYRKEKTTKKNEMFIQEWNVELKTSRLDSILLLTKIEKGDFLNLKRHLKKANCISVSNRDEFEIGYARSGMGKYSYLIFDKPLSKEDQKRYNNGCEYIFHRDNIVLLYGGGAVGSICFPEIDL